jgi:hypothetical protein
MLEALEKGDGMPEGLRCREGWRSILSGRREIGTWIVVGAGKPVRC